jgi:hypothetical protein
MSQVTIEFIVRFENPAIFNTQRLKIWNFSKQT